MIAERIGIVLRLGIMLMTALTMIQIKVVEVIAAEADTSAIHEWLKPSRMEQSEDYIFDFFTQEFLQNTTQINEVAETLQLGELNQTQYEYNHWSLALKGLSVGLLVILIIAVAWRR